MAVEIIAARTPRLGAGPVTDEQTEQPLHERRERFVLGEEAHDDRVVLERAHHAPALDRELDHLGQQPVEGPRAVFVGLGRVESRLEPRELDLHRGHDDLLLGLELVVDRGLRHADRVGDHL